MKYLHKTLLLIFVFSNLLLNGQTLDSISFIPQKTNTPNINNRFEIGIIGGPNLLNIKDKFGPSLKFQVGTSYGINFQSNFREHSAIVINWLFENKKYSSNYYASNKKYNLSFLTLPIMYKYSVGKRNFFYLNGGPFLSFQYKSHNSITYSYSNQSYSYIDNHVLGYFGVVAGIGARIPLSKRIAFTIEVQDYYRIYGRSLPNISYTTANALVGMTYKFGSTEEKTAHDSTYKKEKHVFVKLFYAPQITYRKAHGKTTNLLLVNYDDWWETFSYNSNQEIPMYGYELGILTEFKRSKHFNITTGITLDNQGFQTKDTITSINYSEWGDMIGYRSGTIYNQPQITYKFQFVSLPLIFNYQIKTNNLPFEFGAGPEIKYLYKSSVKINNKEYSNSFYSPDNENSKSIRTALFLNIHIGTEALISKKTSLFFEPYFRCQIGSIQSHPQEVWAQLWSAGCRVGIKF